MKAITMSAWVRPTAWDKGMMCVMQKGDNQNSQFSFFCWKGRCYCKSSTGRKQWNAAANSSGLDVNIWQHVAAVYDAGGSFRFYRNGGLLGVAGANVEMSENGLPLLIGADPWGDWEYLIGDMDDVRIYNRALSEAEIAELYKAESTPPKK